MTPAGVLNSIAGELIPKNMIGAKTIRKTRTSHTAKMEIGMETNLIISGSDICAHSFDAELPHLENRATA